MSDFVVWLSPLSMPDELRRRFRWLPPGTVGYRHGSWRPLGTAHRNRRSIVAVGRAHGRRDQRINRAPSQAADALMAALADRGPQALDAFLGPLAGAMVDGDQILVWRDRFGRHPVQLIDLPAGWAATTDPEVSRQLSDQTPRWSHLQHFICGSSSTSDTDVFCDLYRLRPSEYLSLSVQGVRRRGHWWAPGAGDVDEPVPQLRHILDEMATSYHATPHTLALSAGLDSAALAAAVTNRCPGADCATFSDPASQRDEAPGAASVAEYLDLKCTPFAIDHHWPLSRIDDHYFPLAWGPAPHPDGAWKMPFYRWLSSTAPGRPVMYGNGADEVLWCPTAIWLKSRFSERDIGAVADAVGPLSATYLGRMVASHIIDQFDAASPRSWLPRWPTTAPAWQQPHRWLGASSTPVAAVDFGVGDARFIRHRRHRLRTWRWEQAMRSLAHEARSTGHPIWTPFLDAQFWELCLSLNPGQLVQGGRQKSTLRQAVGDRLPEDCRQRPKGGGFDAVVERGLADCGAGRVYDLLARPQVGAWPDFDVANFLDAYNIYRRDRPRTRNASYRGSWAIWKTVATALWLRRHPSDPACARPQQSMEVRR